MTQSIATAFFLIGLAAFMIYFIMLLVVNGRLPKDTRSSLANSYPYQFYMDQPVAYRTILYVLLGLSALGIGAAESLYLFAFKTVYMDVLGIVFPLALICLVFSNFISLNHYKTHILLSSLGFFGFIFGSLLLSFVKVVPGGIALGDINLPIYILIGVLGGLGFLSMFNPKLSNWAKMDRAEENGKVYYVKPKVNFYALYEWVYLILMEVTALLMFLDMILTQAAA